MSDLVRLNVATFNVRYGSADDGEHGWGNRYAAVGAAVRAMGPDLLALQEALDFQSLYIGQRLASVDGEYDAEAYGFLGAGRDDGWYAGEMVPLFYRKSALELVFGSHLWLSEHPHAPGSRGWGATLPRMATWAVFRTVDGGREIRVVNAHLDFGSKDARLEGARLIRRFLSVINPGGGPTLVFGDFNEDPAGPAVAALMGAGDPLPLNDAYRQAHPTVTRDESTYHGFAGRGTGGRIDYILASPHFTVTAAAIDRNRYEERWPSDHFPVTATLELG
jgi:endonuclease/exonuclease/phosphatase family metal-dependent hydrolase